MYILKCANGAYYTGSTQNLERRLEQHQAGEVANFTKKHLPVTLVYYEEYQRIDDAFYREKQVQGWSRAKKEALINGKTNLLHKLAECGNDTHFRSLKKGVSTNEKGVSTDKTGVSTSLNAQLDSSLSEAETSLTKTSVPTDEKGVSTSLNAQLNSSLSEAETSLTETNNP
ncbi:MAG: GIY-YIG nuclease family protein [Bacteroidia bacterium]|nr:GIY-YIG nuclease family protein [Bacteroidia bacterium]